MKTTKFFSFTLCMTIIQIVYPQTTVSIAELDDQTVVKYTNGQGTIVYEMQGGQYNDDIGMHINSINGNTTGQYRTQHTFNLSGNIPSNATITSAKIEYNLWDWSVTNSFVICKLQTNYAFQQYFSCHGRTVTKPIQLS